MATARCYTKSGSVEKYESNLWSMDSVGVAVVITGPDSSGNYTVTPPSEYEDSNTPTGLYCYTIYGGVKKTFYFKEKITTINIKIRIGVIGENSGGNIVFKCTISSDDDNIMNDILRNNSIILSYSVVNTNGPVGKYTTRVTSGMTLLNPGISYVFGKMYYVEGGASTNPSSGTLIHSSKKYNWDISVFIVT